MSNQNTTRTAPMTEGYFDAADRHWQSIEVRLADYGIKSILSQPIFKQGRVFILGLTAGDRLAFSENLHILELTAEGGVEVRAELNQLWTLYLGHHEGKFLFRPNLMDIDNPRLVAVDPITGGKDCEFYPIEPYLNHHDVTYAGGLHEADGYYFSCQPDNTVGRGHLNPKMLNQFSIFDGVFEHTLSRRVVSADKDVTIQRLRPIIATATHGIFTAQQVGIHTRPSTLWVVMGGELVDTGQVVGEFLYKNGQYAHFVSHFQSSSTPIHRKIRLDSLLDVMHHAEHHVHVQETRVLQHSLTALCYAESGTTMLVRNPLEPYWFQGFNNNRTHFPVIRDADGHSAKQTIKVGEHTLLCLFD